MPVHCSVGTIIREARQARHWTQADLSHYSRLSTSDISKIESGRLIASRTQLQRLAAALGKSEEHLFRYQTAEHPV